MRTIDLDGHIYEPRDMWQSYTERRLHESTIRIADDALGYGMLTYKGNQPPAGYAWISRPTGPEERRANGPGAGASGESGAVVAPAAEAVANSRFIAQDAAMGSPQRRRAQGLPSLISYDDVPPDFTDPAARVKKLDEWGVDGAVLFPNWGLEFEALFFDDDIEGHKVNLAAWNRWAADVQAEGNGRLYPVGHLTLRGDSAWAVTELGRLARSGVKFAFFTPGLINGKRMSHPDNDPIWQAYVDNDIVLTFHATIGVPRLIPAAWTENDHATFGAVGFLFQYHPVQLGLGDMVMNGVFDRFPQLRVAVVEEDVTVWLPWLARTMDRYYISQPAITGHNVATLKLKPSDYLKERCRFVPLSHENVLGAIGQVGDVFGFGGDYPHFEGLPDSMRDFKEMVGTPSDPAKAALLYGGNANWLIDGI